MRYIFRRLSAILSSDFVVRFCPQNFSSTFNEPSAKPTRARVLGTNQRSRARLIMKQFGVFHRPQQKLLCTPLEAKQLDEGRKGRSKYSKCSSLFVPTSLNCPILLLVIDREV
jgi:hypothetical protein